MSISYYPRFALECNELFPNQAEVAAQEQVLIEAWSNKALIDLYRQDGSLLERRRISASGCESVKL
jgi:hypothetical protein